METIQEIFNNVYNFILSLNPSYIKLAVWMAIILTVTLVYILIYKLAQSEQLAKKYAEQTAKTTEKLVGKLKNSKGKTFNYDEIATWMQSSGLNYMTGKKLTVLGYIVLRIFFALFFMIVGLQLSAIGGIVGLVIGWLAIPFVINQSDKSDNSHMLEDIKTIYDTLRIQTKAGVYITSVLTDCYLVVQNKRLKQALLELTSDIVAKNDLEYSLEEFKSKFNNDYINSLVIIINQSTKTGYAVQMFEDMRKEIEGIDLALMHAEQTRIKWYITIVQFLMYGVVILLAIYSAMIGLQMRLK